MCKVKKILVADDDPHLREIVSFSLKQSGFDVDLAENGSIALEKFFDHSYDLVILDIIMPQMDGTDVCREIRKTSQVPIFFLTSKSEEVDRIVGLELGGDDYVTKPFSPRELVARVKALFRRIDIIGKENHQQVDSDSDQQKKIIYGPIAVDFEALTVHCQNQKVDLTPIEFKLLTTMIHRPNKVFARSELMNQAYDDNVYVSDRTIDSHIRKVRQKFSVFEVDPFTTVHGIGYTLKKL